MPVLRQPAGFLAARTWRCWSSRRATRARSRASSMPTSTSCAPICIWRNAIGWSRRAPCGKLCTSCALTRTRPNDTDTTALAAFADAEKAKRRLIAELFELKLPIVGRDEDPNFGLAFDLLSSEYEKVFTGHHNGVITLDLAEGDDVHREQLRIAMDEPYRTLLGHFRHEIGHYYFYRLVEHLAGLRRSGSANCSATPTPTIRRRSTGTTAKVRRRTGKTTTSRPTPRCTPPRTGPRPSRTTCTSATPSTPPRRSASHRRPRRSSGRCWVPAASTRSSTCGCRCRGR